MASGVSLPRRKSAQRAGNSLKKLAVFIGPGPDNEEEDYSDGFVQEDVSSSSDDGSEEMDSIKEESTSAEDDIIFSDGELSERRLFGQNMVWNTAAIHKKIFGDFEEKYIDKLSFMEPAALETRGPDEKVDISVNGMKLPALCSIDSENISIGYAGGTVSIAKWVPNSDILCLAVCNSAHIVDYKLTLTDSLQFWNYKDGKLSFLYSLKISVFYDFIVFPHRISESPDFILCAGCSSSVKVFRLPVTSPEEAKHSVVAKQSLELSVSSKLTEVRVLCMDWSFFNDRVHLLGGLSNGYVIVWVLSASDQKNVLLPSQKIAAHPGHPIAGISVNPQLPNFFCSIAQDSRLKFWNLKNSQGIMFSQTRPQKQLLLPSKVQWCSFWGTVLVLSHMPFSKKSSRFHANSSLWQFPTRPLNSSNTHFQNCLLPKVFPEALSRRTVRCFDFSDADSILVMGCQYGLVCLEKVANLRIIPKSKETVPKATNFLYLKSTVSSKPTADISKEFQNDQDYINHLEFSLSTELSSELSDRELFNNDFRKKTLTSVTHVEILKNSAADQKCIFIGYMSGLFHVLKTPKILTNSKVK